MTRSYSRHDINTAHLRADLNRNFVPSKPKFTKSVIFAVTTWTVGAVLVTTSLVGIGPFAQRHTSTVYNDAVTELQQQRTDNPIGFSILCSTIAGKTHSDALAALQAIPGNTLTNDSTSSVIVDAAMKVC